MPFNRYDFWLFFGAVFLGHWALRGKRARLAWLLAASAVYCAAWSWEFLGSLCVMVAAGYWAGNKMDAQGRPGRRRAYLLFGLAVCLGTLVLFKLNAAWSGSWVMPIGLSYYALQSAGYLIDVYRGEAAARGLLNYALYVSFFPHLLTGPIYRAQEFLPQLGRPRRAVPRRFLEGGHLILWGLFQKTVVADRLAPWVAHVFDGPQVPVGGMVLAGVYAFTIQVYCDLAGYTDMARGAAKCLGLELPLNFRAPFFARDMFDFWRRWHITLTRWWIDYVYKPLFWSRWLPMKFFAAPILTMLLMGLWHGVNGPMIAMGAYYGALMAVWGHWARSREKRSGSAAPGIIGRLVGPLLTFHLFAFGLIFFRAPTLERAATLLRALVSDLHFPTEVWSFFAVLLGLSWVVLFVQALQEAAQDDLAVMRLRAPARIGFYFYLLYGLLVFGETHTMPFIYAQF